MSTESDFQLLARDTRQRLIREFMQKHATFQERVRRLPTEETMRIAKEFSCSPQIATVVYLINMDEIMSSREAIDLLFAEMQRRNSVGENIPNIPGSILEFALGEGEWIEQIATFFANELELRVRELSNLETALDDSIITTEKALAIIAARTKIAEGFIQPIVETWLKEHPKSTVSDALTVFANAITRWNRDIIRGKANYMRHQNEVFFQRLLNALEGATESANIALTINRVKELIAGLRRDFDNMDVRTLSHFLLHIVPRHTGRGDRAAYVDVGTRSTRGQKAEPDMSSPFDFLERDVLLARRRPEEERFRYLNERMGRVVRVLRYNGNDILVCLNMIINEISSRLNIRDTSLNDTLKEMRNRLSDTPADQQESVLIQLIYDYLRKNFYEA